MDGEAGRGAGAEKRWKKEASRTVVLGISGGEGNSDFFATLLGRKGLEKDTGKLPCRPRPALLFPATFMGRMI
jgi:hypothetical protein